MKINKALLLCLVSHIAFAQTKFVEFTVVKTDPVSDKYASSHVKAVLPKGEGPQSHESRKIRFYPRPVPFTFRGAHGLLTWFSYTNPPKGRKTVFVEADQPSFGSLLYRETLYVCASSSPQSSVPVINELLASAGSNPLTEEEAR